MKREREEEMKTQRGGVSFFFFDLSNMTKATAGLYVLGIAIIFYVMFAKLFSKPVDFTKQKKQERLAKKSNSKTSSSSKKTQ
jgi:hypothetical protein